MSNYCAECRFYEGSGCSATGGHPSGGSMACSKFSIYGRDKRDDVKYCRDCRFFMGSKCSVTGGHPSGASMACSKKATAR